MVSTTNIRDRFQFLLCNILLRRQKVPHKVSTSHKCCESLLLCIVHYYNVHCTHNRCPFYIQKLDFDILHSCKLCVLDMVGSRHIQGLEWFGTVATKDIFDTKDLL